MKVTALLLKHLTAIFFLMAGASQAFSQGTPISTPTGLWEFNNSANIVQATVGTNLTVVGTAPSFSATLSDGSKTLTGAITTVLGTANRLIMPNPKGGNGGGSFTNEYTLLFDIFTPVSARSSWRCLMQTNSANTNDGDYFIRNNDDKIGVSSPLGYSGSAIAEGSWSRLVLVFDVNATLTASTCRAYINGSLFHTHNFTGGRDGTYGLESTLLLFCDNSNENASLNVGAVGYWGKLLSAAEITALGAAGAPIQGAILSNAAPVITEGASAPLTAPQNGSATITLNATDADGDAMTWSVSGAATNGAAALTTSTSGQATFSYTPSADFTGTDSFTVRSTDGALSDTIVVNVSVISGVVTITEGATTQLVTTLNSSANPLTLNATESNGAAITWSVLTPATNGSAQLVAGNNTSANFTYTPNAGFIGNDTFTVRATNGSNSDDIVVTAVVAYSSGNTRTFYSQNFNSAILLPEVTTSAERRMPAGDNTPVWNTPQGSGLSLSSGNNILTNPVNDRIVEFEGFNLLRTDFWRNGDDQGRSTAFAASNNVIAVADSDEYTDGGGTGGGGDEAEFNVFLRTPFFILPAGANLSQMTLSFLSAFRTEEDETCKVRVFVNGSSTPSATLNVPTIGTAAAAAAPVSFSWSQMGSPPAGSAIMLEFGHEDADNNWWWALDDIFVGIPNQVPVITEGETIALNAQLNAPNSILLNVTDGDGDAIQWSISSSASNGSASVMTSSNSQASIGYTPALNYTGTDTFTVRVSDGAATDSIVVSVSVLNGAPVIAEGETYNLSATKNGGARTVTFTAVDPNNNPLIWSIITPATNGIASITGNNNTEGVISYNPTNDYSGPDSFTVQVTDGAITDSILVNVTVADPVSDPKLTIIAARGTATPAAGVHEHPRGTALTNSITDEIGTTTRHLCTGWTMTGNGPFTGTAKTMDMVLTRDSVLTWTFRTEHRVETAVSGTGIISVSSGWYEAGKPLQITATPGSGQYFVGWTGDTSGCQIGGKNIVIPMDRARSTITATFAVNENFTFIALPDTQNYTSISSPTDLYTRQTQWIVDNKDTMNIKFVTHLGDIVNSPSSQSQWTRATDAMNRMNTRMPYGTAPGNHDLASGDTNYLVRFGPNPTHSSSVGRWINPANSQTYEWYRGASPRGYSSYQIVRVNGRDYGFMHLDMDTPDQDMAWANSVLAANPKVPTMVSTHNYLAETGGTGAYGSGTGQRGYTAQANISIGPDRNRPQEVFDVVVKPNRQVYMVICGHNFATYNLQKTNNAGKAVHEVVVDYQSLPNGGNGFLRIMEYRPSQNQIYNTSYSPYLGRYVDPNNSADHQGMLDLHDRNGSEFALTTDFDTRFNTTLTVASPFGGVSPAVGSHSIEDLSPVAISAQEQVVGQTRYRPIGWNLTGSQTASGLGSSATITHNGAATLSWSYATEHYLTTATTGSGIVSTNSGWYAAGAVVNIQAQPDAGASFLQWTGDTAGCTVNGTIISVPMDRPRGPITAQFSSPLAAYNVEIVSAYPGVTPSAAVYTYEQGQEVTFSAADIPGADTRRVCTGYNITGGLTQTGTEKSVTLTITSNIVITWNWRTQYLLSTSIEGPGSLSGGLAQWIDEGAPVTLTATPNTGAVFTAWSGDTAAGSAVGNQFTIAAMTRPVGPLTAGFMTAQYSLTVVSSQVTTSPAPGGHSYAFGSTVDFSALAATTGRTRQRPTGWTLSDGSSGSTTQGSIVISGNVTLTWTFAPEVYLEITGGSEGVVTPMNAAGWYAHGSNVTLTAAPEQQYTFLKFSDGVMVLSTSPTMDLLMDQPRTVTADFKAQATTDGTPHWWLDRNTTVTAGNYEAASRNDIDNDGTSAGKEFHAGTSDLQAAQRFQVRNVSPSADGLSLEFFVPTKKGRVYQLLQSTTLGGAFTPVGAAVAGNDLVQKITLAKPTGAAPFYLVQASLTAGTAQDADPFATSFSPLPGSLDISMNPIPAGSFIQGKNTGPLTTRPEHSTQVAGFHIDKFEVTRAVWESVATWALGHGYDIPVTLRYNQAPYNVPQDHPAVAVSWYDAVKWCNARSEMEGRHPVYFTDNAGTIVYRTGKLDLTSAQVNWAGDGYRLPTESEWERASRGGIEQADYPWGNDASDYRANHWDYQILKGRAPNDAYPYTERVGYFDGTQFGGAPDMANAFGLYDMAGNAWEWTWDRMGDYSGNTEINPRGSETGTQRVQRGGAWWNYIDQATNHQRLPFPPNGSDDYGMIGFRCIRTPHPNEATSGSLIASALAARSAPFTLNPATGTELGTVALSSPTEGATFEAGSTIPLQATATDTDGTIVKVEFYAGETLLGESTTAPYAFSWVATFGSHLLTAVAEDSAGARVASPAISISVGDTAGPALTLPAPITAEATSPAGAIVTYTASAADAGSGVDSSSFTPASGSTFALGTTSVAAFAEDNLGNTSTGSFSVTVVDTTDPVVTASANISVAATSPAGASVTFTASATDAVGVTELTYSPASGSTFPIGTTVVTVTAADAAANEGTATFSVTVSDTTAPVVTAPANISVAATSPAGASVTFTASATDAVGVTELTYSPASGSTFPLGTTTVTITAGDAAGNTSTAAFSVTVSDTTAPVITAPANISVAATSLAGATVSYPPATATDAVGVTNLSYSPASGSTFPIGTTTVTISATDAAGNSGTGSFSITVAAPSLAVAITSPAQASTVKFLTTGVKVTGTAAAAATAVTLSINGGAAIPATLSSAIVSGSKTWSATVTTFTGGTNTVTATATGGTGLGISAPRSLFYEVATTLGVTLSPAAAAGTVTFAPALAAGKAIIGRNYTATAKANKGFFFSHWSGKASGTVLSAPFTFAEGDTLVAHFITSPFTSTVAGAYNGVVRGSNPASDTQANSGLFTATVTQDAGAFTGRVMLDGVSAAIAGTFDSGVHNGGVHSFSSPAVSSGFVHSLTLDIGSDQIHGTITKMHRGKPVAYIAIDAPHAGIASPAHPGSYNVAFSAPVPTAHGSLAADEYPAGEGFATLVLAPSTGAATVTGSLADGTVFTSSVLLCRNGSLPVYSSFTDRIGSLWGIWDLNDLPGSDLTGQAMHWFRSPNHAQYYPEGYGAGLTVEATGTKRPTAVSDLLIWLGLTAGDSVDFSGGPFSSPANYVLSTASTAATSSSYTSADKLTKLTFSTTTGLITGEHKASSTAVKHDIKGIIIGKGSAATAHGYILSPQPAHTDGTGLGGRVQLNP